MSRNCSLACLLFVLAAIVLCCGCSTVRSDAEGEPILAFWVGAQPQQHELVANVLRDHGLHMTVDHRGVVVKAEEQYQAYEVLLTDERLKEYNLLLFAPVRAGTGRRTEEGVMALVAFPSK